MSEHGTTYSSSTLANGNTISLRVTSDATCPGTATSSAITMTVNPSVIPAISIIESSNPICDGASVTFSINEILNGGISPTYQWQVNGFDVPGATGSTYTTNTLADGDYVRVVLNSSVVCAINPAYSNSITIHLHPEPTVTITPDQVTICSGTAPAIALSGSVSGTTFAWTVTQTGITGATAGSGSSISQILTNTVNTPGNAVYSVTPSANGCNGTPVNVTVTVNPVPGVTPTPASQALCSGTAASIVLTSNVAGAEFSWTVTQTGVSGAMAGNGSTIAQTLTATGNNLGTAIYNITPSANGCNGPPVNVTVTVNPIPDAIATPTSQAICSVTASSISLTSNVSGATFTWTVTQTGVSGATSGSGSSINQTLTNAGTTSGTAVYTITPSANGCDGTPINVTITVNPVPSVISNPDIARNLFRRYFFNCTFQQCFSRYFYLDGHSDRCDRSYCRIRYFNSPNPDSNRN